MKHLFFVTAFLVLTLFSCHKNKDTQIAEVDPIKYFSTQLTNVFNNSDLPENLTKKIFDKIESEPAFIMDFFTILQGDPYLRFLVDKQRPLPSDYEPSDLVELKNKSYVVNRNGLLLREAAEASLEEMAAAAKAEGLTLIASSTYRSYQYQVEVYARNVREMGKEEADRVSAMPGHSQHQLGLAVDFGSITNDFAKTAAGIWLKANAARFGWSLSFPEGMEPITGYSWESWHFRYVGRELAEFIDNYFDGVQQYALRFIYEWENYQGE
jgi:D-alanyl-D-alanine carboxypeptidase